MTISQRHRAIECRLVDGILISAWLYEASRRAPAIIMSHGVGQTFRLLKKMDLWACAMNIVHQTNGCDSSTVSRIWHYQRWPKGFKSSDIPSFSAMHAVWETVAVKCETLSISYRWRKTYQVCFSCRVHMDGQMGSGTSTPRHLHICISTRLRRSLSNYSVGTTGGLCH